MIIDNNTALALSRLSSRGAFGEILKELEPQIDNLMVVVADVMTSARLVDFQKQASEKLVNVGIAEQNMIGIAAGLAAEGYNVFATTFAPFASMRCFEALRTQLGYMNLNVKVVGLLSGFSGGTFGNTHYGLEDLSITRTIPNMTVLSPADCVETIKAVEAAAKHVGPVYIRLTGVNGSPCVYKEDYDYVIGKGIVLSENCEGDIALIATGTMVNEALRASRALKKDGISVTVVDMHTIKPLDTDLLDTLFAKHKLIFTIEEHSVIGGLGSAVAEYKATLQNTPKQIMLGIQDKFEKAGDHAYMLEKCGLSAPKIVETVRQNI